MKYGSFANRLTSKVILVVVATMAVAACAMLAASFRAVSAETDGRYGVMMSLIDERLNRILATEEICARNVFDEVWSSLDAPELVMEALEKEIKLNSYTEGYFMAFEPYYYPERGRWFEVYMNKNRDDHARNIGSAEHDYLNNEWYKKCKEQKSAFWTNPHFDMIGQSDDVCSFVMPLYDKKDELAGVCGADMSLKWLANELQIIDANLSKEYEFYTFIINSSGTYISHPQWERVMKENLLSFIDKTDDEQVRVVHDLMQMKRGKASLMIDGVWSTVYYAPLESTNWSVGIVVPKRAMWLPSLILTGLLLLIAAVGLIAVYFLCRSNIRRMVSPLSDLAKSADEVARGNFGAPLPVIEYRDEVSKLRDSFAAMQQSLVRYIEDMREKTAKETALNHDLEIARRIQMSMIPENFPPSLQRNDIDLYGFLTPAKSIGGDLYDFFIRDEKLFFCIGDVSGKGISAALMMAAVHYMFRIVSGRENDPKLIVEIMNNYLSAENKSLVFCTFFLGVLDLKTHLMKYCNAGHEMPILITDEVKILSLDHNVALGVLNGFEYTPGEIQLQSGNAILLCTDGLKEATNQEEECFEKDRMMASLQRVVDERPASVAAYIQGLVDDVAAFVKDAPQADDLTLLAIKIPLS